eukprot:TRINITY_DN7865_c1_g4_i3.p1 TRINITY_DN7865_c1_g4~~TRINITY_DN7865_c1_g4_i3.p1  ORF type:complete len:216 (+),score=41.22 TRINITY_DN7865_c1_g4_i3:36-650(+)
MPRRQSQAWLNSGATLRRPGDWVCECQCRNFRWRGNCYNCGKGAKETEQPSGWDLALKGWRSSRQRHQHDPPQPQAQSQLGLQQAPTVVYQPVCFVPVPVVPIPPQTTAMSELEEETKLILAPEAGGMQWLRNQLNGAYDAEGDESDEEEERVTEEQDSLREATPGPVTPQEEPTKSTAELNKLFADLLNLKLSDEVEEDGVEI